MEIRSQRVVMTLSASSERESTGVRWRARPGSSLLSKSALLS